MVYYRDSVTEASWQLLLALKRRFKFCLIGGWAVWLYTHQLKSKDIDILVEPEELGRIRKKYDLFKNNRLKKYEFRKGEVQIDVYPAYYADLGIKAEEILSNSRIVEGFLVPAPEVLFILKLIAWLERKHSAKGRKDLIDLVSLLPMIGGKGIKLNHPGIKNLTQELKAVVALPELNLNRHQWVRTKKRLLLFLNSQ
jgi:hypothetical protein